MPIAVTCPGCHKRFTVHEKFGGQKGPCPSCKTVITIPEAGSEVVIHAPESYGPKDAAGRPVLKPLEREEAKLSIPLLIALGAVVIGSLVAALVLRNPEGQVSTLWLSLGAILLGPPLAMAGYTFLRDDELEPYRGRALWIRSAICGVSFAVLWGVYALLHIYLFGGDKLEVFQLAFIVPPMLVAGAGIALVCFDLDFGSAAMDYGLYLGFTVMLRLLMNLGAF